MRGFFTVMFLENNVIALREKASQPPMGVPLITVPLVYI